MIGYSLGDSFINYKESQFNVAEAVAMSRDMMFMTNELIRRIKTDPRVNIEQDWKVCYMTNRSSKTISIFLLDDYVHGWRKRFLCGYVFL